MRDIIINLQKSDTLKIQLTVVINVIFSKDVDEERQYDNVNEVVNEIFKSLLSRCQIDLETSMRGSDFIFDSVQLMHYKYHKINFKRGGSYIDSPDWMKKKKATINPKNEDDKCFHYVAIVALNHEEIKRDTEGI